MAFPTAVVLDLGDDGLGVELSTSQRSLSFFGSGMMVPKPGRSPLLLILGHISV
jgi:hypothetical protein